MIIVMLNAKQVELIRFYSMNGEKLRMYIKNNNYINLSIMFILIFFFILIPKYSWAEDSVLNFDAGGIIKAVSWPNNNEIYFECLGSEMGWETKIIKFCFKSNRSYEVQNTNYRKERRYFLEPIGKREIYYEMKSDLLIIKEGEKTLLECKLGYQHPAIIRPLNAISEAPPSNSMIPIISNKEDFYLYYWINLYGTHIIEGRAHKYGLSKHYLFAYNFKNNQHVIVENPKFDFINYLLFQRVLDYNEGTYLIGEDRNTLFYFDPIQKEKKTIFTIHNANLILDGIFCPKVRKRLIYFLSTSVKSKYPFDRENLYFYNMNDKSIGLLFSNIKDYTLSKNLIALKEVSANRNNNDEVLKVYNHDSNLLLSEPIHPLSLFVISPSEDRIAVVEQAAFKNSSFGYKLKIYDIKQNRSH